MKDPGPNVLEQQIETNRLLALLVAAAPADAAPTVLSGGAVPIQWPILFYFADPTYMPFTVTISHAGGYAALSNADKQSLSGHAALKIVAPVGVGKWTRAEIDIPETPSRKVRLQIALANEPSTKDADWNICLSYHDRTNLHRAMIHLKAANEEALFANAAGGETSLGNFAWSHLDTAWNKVDLSVDFALDEYHYVAVNHTHADLSGQGLFLIADPTWPRLRLRIELMNQVIGDPVTAFADQVLVTDGLYDLPTEPE